MTFNGLWAAGTSAAEAGDRQLNRKLPWLGATETPARIDEKEPEEIETYRDGKKAAKDKAVRPKSSRGGP